jgi:ribosomal protein S11
MDILKYRKILKLKKSFSRLLHIRVNPNNIFFNLKLIKPKIRTLAHASSGLFKVKLTKKRLSHNAVSLLDSFLSRVRAKIFRRNLIIVIIAPKNLKFKLIKSISQLLKKRKLIIYIKPLKCFNGCRPPKKRRRKQKGLRLLKK